MVILIGASVRAAAMSALRAGWTPWCADLFADADLARIAAVRKVPLERYPRGLLEALADAPPGPVIYAGALENRPDLIARIDRPLWGNGPCVLRAIRSPERWTRCLEEAGLPCPALAADRPRGGRWLVKPRKSGGGIGIVPYAGQPFNPRTHFLQEHLDGPPVAAVFVAIAGAAHLLGVTAQIIGADWLNAVGFHYAGSIGPLPLDAAQTAHWSAVGTALTRAFDLRGLFGVDAILRDGVPWPVEINPRYTASVEVLERAYGMSFLPCHRAAFVGETWGHAFQRGQSDPGNFGQAGKPGPAVRCKTHGKAILHARRTVAFPARGPWQPALESAADFDSGEFADIPHNGEVIAQGRPVLTVFATGESAADCLAKLRDRADCLDRHLSQAQPGD